MGDSPRRGRYSESPSPRRRYSRSRSPARRYSRSPARRENGGNEEAINPGNNLYVTGLSTRVTEKDLEEHFSREGKVTECRLVVDPRSRESRGFGFVTMESLEDAERCIKYLNRSTLEGRIITCEKECLFRTRVLHCDSRMMTGWPSEREQGHLLPVLILVCELPCEVLRVGMVVTMTESEIGTETTTVLDGLLATLHTGAVENVTGSVSGLLVILEKVAMVVIGLVLHSTLLTDVNALSIHSADLTGICNKKSL